MSNLNKVILIGRLTSDPALRHTPKGSACAEFGIAINRSYTTEAGEKREETTFVDLTFWGKTAEICAKYLSKGKLICVEGRLKFDTWNDKVSGKSRSKLSVLGENMSFLEPASTTTQRPSGSNTLSRSAAAATLKPDPAEDDDWDESPF